MSYDYTDDFDLAKKYFMEEHPEFTQKKIDEMFSVLKNDDDFIKAIEMYLEMDPSAKTWNVIELFAEMRFTPDDPLVKKEANRFFDLLKEWLDLSIQTVEEIKNNPFTGLGELEVAKDNLLGEAETYLTLTQLIGSKYLENKFKNYLKKIKSYVNQIEKELKFDDFIKRETDALIQLVTYEQFDKIEDFLRDLIKEAIARFG